MPDETLNATQPIGSSNPGPPARVESSPAARGDATDPGSATADCGSATADCGSATADCGSATAADERPRAFQATEAIDSVRTNGSMDVTGAFDATGPLGIATEAGTLPNSQGDAFPTGAFDPTGMATGDYDATEPGTPGVGPTMDGFLTQAEGPPGDGERSAQSQQRCGNYVLKNFFAKGGMGEVWLAEDPAIGRSVALKRMLGKPPTSSCGSASRPRSPASSNTRASSRSTIWGSTPRVNPTTR